MECPSCHPVSKNEPPKFCSQCGVRLPAVPKPDPQTHSTEVVQAPEGEMECGEELKEDGGPSLSLDSETVNHCSKASSTVQRGVASEVFDEWEVGVYPPSKRRNVDPSPFEVTSTSSADSQQRKRKKNKKKKQQRPFTSDELDSLPLTPSAPSSLSSLEHPGSMDLALQRNQDQQDGVSSQPQAGGAEARCDQNSVRGQPLASGADARCDQGPPSPEVRSQNVGLGMTQMEGDGPIGLLRDLAKASIHPLQGQTGVGEAATRGKSQMSAESQDQDSSSPTQEGAGLPKAAPESPVDKDTAQTFRLPESQGDHAEPREGAQTTTEQTGAPASQASDAPAEPAHDVQRAGKDGEKKSKKEKLPPTSVPASREHGQEAETKGKMALPGGKAGESKKAQPEDQKKPEEDGRTYPESVKNAKGQRTQSASARDVESTLSPGEGITVCFHAIVSKHFSFNPNQHRVFIRGGEEFGKPKWNRVVCEMSYTKDLGEHGSLIEGTAFISKQNLDKPIPYKYVIACNKEQYEFIYKPQQKEGEHVNRCLHIRSSLLDSGEWHQYDDIICMKPPGTFQKFRNLFKDGTRENLVKGKQIAAEVMLDSIFGILQTWNAISLKGFFTQFLQFYSVVREPTVYEGGPQQWSSFLQYGEREVKRDLWKYLKGKMGLFQQRSSKEPLPEDWPVRSGLRMGLIVLFAVEKFALPVSDADLSSLCYLLCARADSPDTLRRDLQPAFEMYWSWKWPLVNLCRRCMDRHKDCWVLTLPVLHHCVGPAPHGKDIPSENTWAALEGLSFSQFRDKRSDQNELLQLMERNKHLLNVDSCLFRSWFSLLPLRDLADYMGTLVEYLVASPAHFLDCFLGVYYRLQGPYEILHRNLEHIEKALKMLLHLLEANFNKVPEEPLLKSYLNVCLKLHKTICKITKKTEFYEIPALSAEIVCRIISLEPVVQDSAETHGSEIRKKDSVKMVFQEALDAIRSWLQRIFTKKIFQSSPDLRILFSYPEEVEVWRRLVEIHFPVEHGWKEALLGDLEGRLKQERPLLQISAYCGTGWNPSGLDDSVAKSFEKCVIEAVSSACQIHASNAWSQISILDGLPSYDLRKFGKIVSAVITKSWPVNDGQAVDDIDEVLKHLLTGPDIKQLFKLYGTDEKMLVNITEDGKKLMGTADSVFTKVVADLLSGTVLVRQLELIEKHKTQFLNIWEIKNETLLPQEKQHYVRAVLDWRMKELLFLKKEKRYIDNLFKLCEKVKHLIKVDFGETAHKLWEDLGSKRLNEAVTVRLPTCSEVKLTTHYNLSPQVRKMAEKVDLLRDSHVFQMFWEEAAESLKGSEEESEEQVVHLEDAYDDLYYPCYKRFTKLYGDLKSGEVTFAEVDAAFKDFVNRYSDLTLELQVMCTVDGSDQKHWIRERVDQIKEYHHLHQAAHSTKVILKVKENLGLKGDFSVLHTLLSFTETFDLFRHEKLTQISQQLIRAKKLLQDISEARRQCLEELCLRKEFISWVREALEDINELKVFVDLASISAGENDIDVDRAACFHDAVQGYASLLYKLDRTAGFDEFMDHLTELWKALENDPHLPKKLCDSARNLEWLKTVKESHGSVELSSLSLATAINNKGIYFIEAPRDGQVSPDSVLRLVLPESHGDSGQIQEYSLEELRELLNKLMLMSGKKEQNNVEVEVFSEVFFNVQRLVQSFINLYSAGNMLFRTWTAEVYCSPRRDISIRMDFNLELVGQLTGSGEVAGLLEALCRQMEHFLDHWKKFVAEKRAEHFYLNFYTSEQLVYLSTELKKPSPSEAALMMLSFIKGNCTLSDVSEAFSRTDGAASRHHVNTVMAELSLMLFSEFSLMDKLRVIMEQSMECMSTFLPRCLDLDALGHCLAYLSTMSGSPVERHLPRGLQVGQPNLVVCSHSEVLLAALAIYMQAPSQPLPTYDEVLLCTPGTTFEEVALFLRRCLTLGSQEHKVYSLLYADQLSYEVGCQVEALFQSLCLQRHREDYKLVLVCDCDREHCYLPSAFSQYKVLVTPQASLESIQTYLVRHFRVPLQTPSAAVVFKDRVCVRVVASQRAGVGKSLYVKRLHSKLKMFTGTKVPLKVIRLMDPQVDESQVLGTLLPFLDAEHQTCPMIFHFDVTSSVQSGIWGLLFKLLVLRYLMDVNGKMWLRNQCHLYIIEILEGNSVLPKRSSKLGTCAPQYSFLDIFTKVTCRPPKEVIDMGLNPESSHREPGMDETEFCSETFQRPYQYLKRFHQKQNLDTFQYIEGFIEGTPEECLQYFLFYCGVINPSWSELRNFAQFLNYQLKDCEASVFCNPNFTRDTLRGFKNFVVTFMIFMARDFATPTLNTSDQSPGKHTVTMDGVQEEDLAPFTLRKRWESEPHPYVFFNGDHISMTFIGFHFQPNQNNGVDAINHLNGKVIKKDVMTMGLYRGLLLQRVPFNVDFDQLPRHKKLEKLCMALGIQWAIDPDETYELTTDNMLKILAIEMRFRCGIPVVIMGETGCGKTRLIKFLSDLRRGGVDAETMKLVKVHGGTTVDMIYSKVREAEDIAIFNKSHHQLDTILFFDEANTTEAISCIKEVLCDHTVNGVPLVENSGLHIIAACNPYRKHSQEMICRLESAGLGYRVRAEETTEKLGSIPLRQLVYRVHALPPSMIPLVWDFGQLNDVAEKLYIQQIVQRQVDSIEIEQNEACLITEVLSASQGFMREREDECSFVSLRDVERCVKVFKWFYDHSEMLLSKVESFFCKSSVIKHKFKRNPVLWSLVQAIGVCYHASLEKKESYRKAICRFFPKPYNDSKVILDELTQTQDLFLNGVPLRKTIAKNLALKENFFMMVVCIELKIPLFLVGKPGSSKSLAKTIVADAMQGQAAYSDLFQNLKQVHLVSFQCSPHSTPQGIIGTFKQCARFQQGKDLQQYVSVVVLDEVGLAEDSPKMPLKALHPLLEDGCIEDDPAPHKKVGFIGISNWALDPAKMNRGIFVSRGSPNEEQLIESAKGICHSDTLIQDRVQGYFASFAKAYQTVCRNQDKEFFGLRDYYSLIKMVFAMAKASSKKPSPQDIAQAILRNFSGKDDINTFDIFTANIPEVKCSEEVSTIQLIRQNIYSGHQKGSGRQLEDAECRYLLVLTKNYVALQILQQTFFSKDQQPEIIFGSSFPKDQEYTQVCRNINRVKICMETGKMVVLLNLQNLYESLYDALNQYYVYLGGQKYVDLGLGTHRVKCRVHPDFHLIVIEEKDIVYRYFPIPLINRLEKHYLDINSVLEKWQKDIVEKLKEWVGEFIHVEADQFQAKHKYSPSDVFIGYHSDTCASVVLQVIERQGHRDSTDDLYQTVFEEAKLILLDCVTPDAMVRLSASSLGRFTAQSLSQEYHYKQQHNSFADFLQAHLSMKDLEHHIIFTEITTFSRLLTSQDCWILESKVKGRAPRPTILSLQQFDTEYSFLKEVRKCLTNTARCKILIIQTDFEDGAHGAQLVASARYSAVNEINKIRADKGCISVYFITKLPRMGSGTSYVGFHGGLWQSVHIDDLHRSTIMVSDVTKLQDVSISQLFKPQDKPEENHDEEEEMEAEMSGSGETAEAEMETESSEATESEVSGLGSSEMLDTTRLLRSCVQSAVGMLRDQNKSFTCNTRRVEILLSLFSKDDEFTASFLRVSKERLYFLLKKQEENMYNLKEWVLREASNQEALQEAGTFRHTLWKRVQTVVTPLLASMISFIDRDGNLELLIKPDFPPWARDLWMFIFSDVKLLDIPPVRHDTRSKSEMFCIVVQNDMKLSENDVPFSWRIKDYLEELWVQAQYITDAKGLPEKLVEIFQQTPLGRFLTQLSGEQQQTLLYWYLKDFLLLTMSVSTWDELKFLRMALWSCIDQLKAASGRPEERVSLPWVHLAYQHFRSRLHNFSRILAVHPQVLGSLTERTQNCSLPECEMTLDALAAVACAEMLTRDTLRPSPQAWLQMVKNLSTPLEFLCSEGHMRGSGNKTTVLVRELRTQWSRIFSVALFVEHVLLGTESQIPELRPLVTDYANSLNKCLQDNSDIKTHRPFMAVVTTLCECKDQASKTFTRFGVQPCPICQGDVQDPVCLLCDHVYCQGCIKTWLIPGRMRCPLCLDGLPDNFSLTVSQVHREAIEKHARFRQMCNSFFVDLVSTMCFKDNTPPQRDVIMALLSLLFVQKELLREASPRHCEHTKSLSPFDDVVDKTPVIRSVVLKLLLKYSFHEVKDYIQDYLSMLEKKPFLSEDKTELYMLFINCLEDAMREKISACSKNEELNYLREEGHFLRTHCPLKLGPEPAKEVSIEYLQKMARVRLCLDRASDFLFEGHAHSEMAEEKQRYLRQVEHFCTQSKNDWFRVYLVRKLTSQHTMEFVQSLAKRGHPAQWVFPKEVIARQEDYPGQLDRFLVYGDGYKALRDAVGKAVLECKPKGITAALEACRDHKTQQAVHLLLALFQEVTVLYRSPNASLHPKPEQCEAVNRFTEETKTLSPEVRHFATSLVANTLPLLRTDPSDGGLEATVTEMAVHAAAVLLCGENNVLEPLRNLAFSPGNMANAFLPTMPEDLLVQARSWKSLGRVQWYTCPNGHPCSVGECGMPMEQSLCPDCHAPVGGVNHRPNAGFHRIENNTDRTQTGHVLGNPVARGVMVVSDRPLSPVVFILIRLLTHLAMFLGAAASLQALRNIIKPPVEDPKTFLQQHIQRDLQQLTRTLGKSADETTNVVHLILRSLLRAHDSHSDERLFNFDARLSTKEARNNWEKVVQTIILSELEHLDKTLLTINTLISQDERISSNLVAKIIYGDPATFLCHLPRKSAVHCSKIWSCSKRITVEHLQHVVEQKNGRETVPILWQFLQMEAELRLVKFLPEILALQRTLVKRFQNVSEVEFPSLRSFIDSHNSDGLKQLFGNRITLFLSTWNKLRRSLETNGEIKLPKDYCSTDLDLDTDFEVILPRRRGRGLCSTALVSYLIKLHSEMVYTVEKFSQKNYSYSIDASEVTDLHVISYEAEQDLMPLILSNCQYKVEQGGEALQEFDLEKIQRQITSRFLQGKPRLTLKGIPTLVYRHDWNYERLFTDIKNKMSQNALPQATLSALGGQLQSFSDTCEALSVIEVTLGFLSTAGGDPNMPLNVYIRDTLRMDDQTSPVLKASNRCQLKHIIALWRFLSAHKCEQLLRLRKDPFREISSKYKVDLRPEDAKLLSTFLNQTDLETFLLELHEMMILKLKNPREEANFNPAWSLRDTLVSYMETKDGDIPPELESQFPEEILLSSCVPVWNMAAELKQRRHTR
ncbi:E3 ubiquitin-protein ligase RNF213 isoform X4 [Loxodonta africana]|uniref:E3 ubiquitin-protein ligase RNF213 isoform X4 n=1 Tax=Loxodonta africana TaxID=9785 RepID=UPI0030CD7F08